MGLVYLPRSVTPGRGNDVLRQGPAETAAAARA